jgi:hypothetical protein
MQNLSEDKFYERLPKLKRANPTIMPILSQYEKYPQLFTPAYFYGLVGY